MSPSRPGGVGRGSEGRLDWLAGHVSRLGTQFDVLAPSRGRLRVANVKFFDYRAEASEVTVGGKNLGRSVVVDCSVLRIAREQEKVSCILYHPAFDFSGLCYSLQELCATLERTESLDQIHVVAKRAGPGLGLNIIYNVKREKKHLNKLV